MSLVSVALYVAFLFNANSYHLQCQDQIQQPLLLFIKLELLIFFMNIVGMIVFLFFKSLMGRCRSKFKFRFETEARFLTSTDILTRHKLDSLMMQIAFTNFIVSVIVMGWLTEFDENLTGAFII